jgi:hypothetical protein
MRRCFSCGNEWVSDKREPSVKETCEHCDAYLHTCKNCRFYTPAAHNQCVSSTAEWVSDKETGNFCGEFEFAVVKAEADDSDQQDEARDAFGSLFGDAGEEEPKRSVDDFNSLFGD